MDEETTDVILNQLPHQLRVMMVHAERETAKQGWSTEDKTRNGFQLLGNGAFELFVPLTVAADELHDYAMYRTLPHNHREKLGNFFKAAKIAAKQMIPNTFLVQKASLLISEQGTAGQIPAQAH